MLQKLFVLRAVIMLTEDKVGLDTVDELITEYKGGGDQVLTNLSYARADLLDAKDSGFNSRELSVCLTNIDTAILWRKEDLRLKRPTENQAAEETA